MAELQPLTVDDDHAFVDVVTDELCPWCGDFLIRLLAIRADGRACSVCRGCHARGPLVVVPGWPSTWPEGLEWAFDKAADRWLERYTHDEAQGEAQP